MRTPGRRVYPNADGELWLAKGDYGKDPRTGHWMASPPGEDSPGMGSLENHEVTEHEDGTITVSPSILITTEENDCSIRWHGHLERGVRKKS